MISIGRTHIHGGIAMVCGGKENKGDIPCEKGVGID